VRDGVIGMVGTTVGFRLCSVSRLCYHCDIPQQVRLLEQASQH
jgi:hypothetical protein